MDNAKNNKTAATPLTLDNLAVGSRLLVRSRIDWRFAAVSKIADEGIVLTVCSPTGRSYRLRRNRSSELLMEGPVPILVNDSNENWRDNFGHYDPRW